MKKKAPKEDDITNKRLTSLKHYDNVIGNIRRNTMSNRISIDPTEFVNIRSGSKTFGVRVYDDYGCAYDNTWESIPDDDMDIIEKVLECENEVIRDMMNFVKEEEKGIDIDGTYYEWDEIKECWQ
jgi:hypothetical protein